jgi:hypothetical protein
MKAIVLSDKEYAQLQKAQQKAALAVVELGDLITALRGEDVPTTPVKKTRVKKVRQELAALASEEAPAQEQRRVYPGGLQVTLADEVPKKRGRPRKNALTQNDVDPDPSNGADLEAFSELL